MKEMKTRNLTAEEFTALVRAPSSEYGSWVPSSNALNPTFIRSRRQGSLALLPHLRAIAYHEAGHALADYLLGFNIRMVSIMPFQAITIEKRKKDDYTVGMLEGYGHVETLFAPSEMILRISDYLLGLYAGRESEKMFIGKRFTEENADVDRRAASRVLDHSSLKKEEALRLQNEAQERAINLVSRPIHRCMIKSLAEALMREKELFREAVWNIFGQHRKMPSLAKWNLAQQAETAPKWRPALRF